MSMTGPTFGPGPQPSYPLLSPAGLILPDTLLWQAQFNFTYNFITHAGDNYLMGDDPVIFGGDFGLHMSADEAAYFSIGVFFIRIYTGGAGGHGGARNPFKARGICSHAGKDFVIIRYNNHFLNRPMDMLFGLPLGSSGPGGPFYKGDPYSVSTDGPY